MNYHLILASASPRRKEILQMLGVSFEVIISDYLEERGERNIDELVKNHSLMKARGVALRATPHPISPTFVLGVDTVVESDGEILEKPSGVADAKQMLQKLSGKTHAVFSGVTLIDLKTKMELTHIEKTLVKFANISNEDLEKYLSSNEWADKSGGYAIQGLASKFITGIEGDYYNVVGLPVYSTIQLCNKMLNSIE